MYYLFLFQFKMSNEREISDLSIRSHQITTNIQCSVEVARTLRRIRQIIADAVRSYECSRNIIRSPLNMAKTNLRRISSKISQDTYDKLLRAIDALFLIKNQEHQQESYVAPRLHSNGKYLSLSTVTKVYYYLKVEIN